MEQKPVEQQPMTQEQPMQQQPLMYHRRITNPCCCHIECGARSIAIINVIFAIFGILGYGFCATIYLDSAAYYSERERERKLQSAGNHRNPDYNHNYDPGYPERESASRILAAVAGYLLCLCILDLILAIILIMGGNSRRIGMLKCWMISTIILLVLKLLSFSGTYDTSMAIALWPTIIITCLITFYFLFVVYCLIQEIKEYPDGRAAAHMQRKMGMSTQQLVYGSGYQQMPAQQSQQGYPTNQPHSNPNAASTTASSTNASASASAV